MSRIPPPPVKEERLEPIRTGANLRSVSRSDPFIIEILEFTDHATVFLNDENGEWKKTKMEGPTFIVHRSKKPFYAVYMLNRMALKNVTIPLIPGEIKTVLLNSELLQVRKRGEEGRSLWIPVENDATGIKRFHNTILKICGEPVKRSEGGGSNTESPTSTTAGLPAAQPGTSDPFARLFQAVGPSSPSSPAPSPQSAPQFAAHSHSRSPANRMTAPDGASQMSPQPAASLSPSAPAEVGNSVDTLLQNLLNPSIPSPSLNGRPDSARLPSSNDMQQYTAHPAASSPAPQIRPTTQTSSMTGQAPRRGRVGDSTFAQATQATPAARTHVPKLGLEDRRKIVEAIAATLAYRHESVTPADQTRLQGSVRAMLVDPSFADEVWATYLAAIDAL